MNIIDAILKAKDPFDMCLTNTEFNGYRYINASVLLFTLSSHALNKEKNKNKPNFEGMELLDIFSHLQSEIQEVKSELLNNPINFRNLLEEIADVCALLTGLVVYVIKHKDEK